jgi:CPA1 family monovalent cation:H+ antiporter
MRDIITINLGLILLVASVVAIISRRIKLPYTVGLVTAGILLARAPIISDIFLSPEGIFTILLPPLIFEAAMQIRWPPFRRDLAVILVLAFAGVAIAAAIVATGLHFLVGWSWIGAVLFGVLISATDPVSVIAAFKEMKVPARLSLLVEAESLLNDGAAAVGFAVVLVVANGSSVDPISLSMLLLWKAIGGFIIGGGLAGGLLLLAGRADDHLVEITLTTIAAYGAFLIAERVQTSGVLASLTAGMVVGNIGWRGYISQSGRGHVLAFWEYAAFLANSVVFILIGLHEAAQGRRLLTQATLIAIALILLGRVVAVYSLSALFRRSALAVDVRHQHILVWGGLRGALGLVLALTLPAVVPERDEIVLATFAVVAFSIFVQGLTMPALVRRLGLTWRPDANDDSGRAS